MKLEQKIIDALTELGATYGVPLRQHIQAKQGKRVVSYGALYCAIDRLEQRGEVRTWQVPGGLEHSYQAKRMVEITEEGHRRRAGSGAKGLLSST